MKNLANFFDYKDIKAEKDEQNQLIEKELSAKKECEKEIAHKNGVLAELEEQIRLLDVEHIDPADLERKNLELEELKKEVQVVIYLYLTYLYGTSLFLQLSEYQE